MKAIRISKFVENYDDLQISNIASPQPRGPDEVLIDIHVAAVNFVDLLYARGKHQNNHTFITPPFTLGLEFAGTLAQSSPSCPYTPGTRIFGSGIGSFASQIVVPTSSIRPIPPGWSFEDAAGLGATAPVSYGALIERAGLKREETVLVHAAAGGLGCMAVQIGKAVGARVIAAAGGVEKCEIARRCGADVAVDYSVEGWERKVLDATGGEGVNVVFDPVGLVEKSLRCLKFGGRLLVVGFAGTEKRIEKVAMNRVLLKQAGVLGYRYGESDRRFPLETVKIWKGVSKMLDHGLIKPVIYEKRYQGLEDVPRALEDLTARKVWGKAVIHIATTPRDMKM
ncbi:MAG: hypothetical protein M1827_001977 [Pycnora praestabilis]|nr:MAG: hypothetical protein M1827_001977 [Pycnora praestabilis]